MYCKFFERESQWRWKKNAIVAEFRKISCFFFFRAISTKFVTENARGIFFFLYQCIDGSMKNQSFGLCSFNSLGQGFFDRFHYVEKNYLCGAYSLHAKILAIPSSSLILSTQKCSEGKLTPSISRPPSGWTTASLAAPTIVKLSDLGQDGKPGTSSTIEEAFGNNDKPLSDSFTWTHVFLYFHQIHSHV